MSAMYRPFAATLTERHARRLSPHRQTTQPRRLSTGVRTRTVKCRYGPAVVEPDTSGGAAPDGAAPDQHASAPQSLQQPHARAPADTEATAGGTTAGDLTMLVGFPPDSAELDREARFVLDETIRILRRHEQSTASITGYSDGLGDDAYNTVLSRERALVVRDYLLASGVERQRLRVQGGKPASGASTLVPENGGLDGEQYRIVRILIDRGGPT